MENFNKKVDFAGQLMVAQTNNPREPYKHQIDALNSLESLLTKDNFASLLVIPTGGGKTHTAINFTLRHFIDKNCKVIWIAHRHALLDQALDSLKNNSYFNIINRPSFNYRILSGIHDKPVNVLSTDDIIIASKDSLQKGFDYLVENWIKPNFTEEIFLIIDEAHHATAKTYRKIIAQIQQCVKNLKVLGLTATPFRTLEQEQGLLKKVFPNDIAYSINLQTLISRGILSEPIFEEIPTKFNILDALSEKDMSNIYKFDIEQITKETAKSIAENAERNRVIVDTYLNNRKKYDQTLIFALNIDNAIALNKLFKDSGVKSDFVVSGLIEGNATISPKEISNKIAKFKKKELNVLINVNILTEGTDIPNVQTVFLTRPTKSTILMTQMIGRGLRGESAGGTKQSFIVSFIDEWRDKFSWVSPEKLFIEETVDFQDDTESTSKKIIKLISIEKIEEFTKIADRTIDTSTIKGLDFLQRIPLGFYFFKITEHYKGEDIERKVDIIVYDGLMAFYQNFINDLPNLFEMYNNDELDKQQLKQLTNHVEDYYFLDCYEEIGYNKDYIEYILKYYNQYEEKPTFIEFKERNFFNIDRLAREIYEQDMGPRTKDEYLKNIWEKDKLKWEAFFGSNNFKFLHEEVDISLRKIGNPNLYKQTIKPIDNKELRNIEQFDLSEIKKINLPYYKELFYTVYEKAKDKDGYYTCAKSGYKSKSKYNFHIDHIIPLSKGGLSTLDNLQVLHFVENRKKSDNYNYVGEAELEIKEDAKKKSEKNITEEINVLNKEILNEPKNGSLYFGRAILFDEIQDTENALKDCKKAIQFGYKANAVYKLSGLLNNDLGNHKEALNNLNQAVKLGLLDDPEIYFFKAISYRETKDFEESFACFEKALKLGYIDEALVFYHRGYAYHELKRYHEAIADFSQSLEAGLDANTFYIFSFRGDSYIRVKDYRSAINDLTKCINLDKNHIDAYRLRAYSYSKIKEYSKALSDYTSMIDLGREEDGYAFRGNLKEDFKYYEEAISDYSIAASLSKEPALYYAHMGRCWSKLRNKEKTLADFDKALKLSQTKYIKDEKEKAIKRLGQ